MTVTCDKAVFKIQHGILGPPYLEPLGCLEGVGMLGKGGGGDGEGDGIPD